MTSKLAKNIELVSVEDLIPYARNARTHSPEQIAQIVKSIQEFGFTNPVLVDEHGGVIAGHGRVMAAKQLNMEQVPCLRLAWLSDVQKRAYILADNKLAENSGWDQAMLDSELDFLKIHDFDLDTLGFEIDSEELLHAEPEQKSETSEVNDVFWINITGPLKNQAQALDRLRSVMADLEPVTVELGTVSRG